MDADIDVLGVIGQFLETMGYTKGVPYQVGCFVFAKELFGDFRKIVLRDNGIYAEIYLTNEPTVVEVNMNIPRAPGDGDFDYHGKMFRCNLVHPDSLERLGAFIRGYKNDPR
jgi:hypothetical protein